MSADLQRMREALHKIAQIASEVASGGSPSSPSAGNAEGTTETELALATESFELKSGKCRCADSSKSQHVYGNKVVCATDQRGYANPGNADRTSLRVDATEGFIPLWAKDTMLRWRIRTSSLTVFRNPQAAATGIERLLGDALGLWGDAVPVRFTKQGSPWDFEIVMQRFDDCDDNGCVLASAFFPDAGRHQLLLYPQMFQQSRQEQVETLAHELGHVFGLRHFFANILETRWRSELFGTDSPFSIMNYGAQSVMTDADRSDLKKLYQLAHSGELTHINGTPIKLVKPFHAS